MNEESHRNLYRWKRQTDSRVYSRSQKVATHNDIQDWIQKVENASNNAAEKVFGSSYSTGKTKGKVASLSTVKQLREHDAALAEAQDLLSQWMDEKVNLSDDVDEEFIQGYNHHVAADVKGEWDRLLDNNYEEWGLKPDNPRPTINDSDPYAFLEHMNEDRAVESVVKHMLNKKVVKDDFSADLGLDEKSKYRDPRMKMELRHKQVKENREKREKELEKRRRDLQARKEAHHKAKQMILKEDKDKHARAKKEEMEIRKEMAKIRKEMQEQRLLEEESKQRERAKKEEIQKQAKEIVSNEERTDTARMLEKEKREEEKRRRLMMKLGEIQTRQEAANLKSLQRHFSAWYNIVLERRLQMGKAKAVYDWKLLLQGWNAWKSFVRSRKLDWETKQHEMNIITNQRKNQAAQTHYRVSLLRKYFVAWQLWVKQEQERQEMENAQQKTKQKMLALLEAAAAGKLVESESDVMSARSGKTTVPMATSEVDMLFAEQLRRPQTSRSDLTTERSETSTSKKNTPQNNRVPTQAWQVTRKHINLTKEEISKMSGGDEDGPREEYTDQEIRHRFGTQPWMNRKYIPDSFQNRHAAQQKILQDQQKQLKEQQRLIQELQFKQNQQANNHQIAVQEMILSKLSGKELPGQQENEATPQQPSSKKAVNNGTPSQKSKKPNVKGKETNMAPDTARTDTTISGKTDISNATSTNTATTNKSGNKYLTTLKNMEERAMERARLKAERDEKRRKAEELRLEQLKAEEEMLLRKAEEEKRARVMAFKEKKRLEKEKEELRQKNMEKMKEMNDKADAHYIRGLMKYRGLVLFKRLVAMAKENEEKAANHHAQELKRKTFQEWYSNVQEIIREKNRVADQMYTYLIVKHYFTNWRMFKHHTTIMEGRAKRIFNRNLKHKTLLAWYEYTMNEKVASVEKDRMAKDHYLSSLLRKTFTKWHTLPEDLKREREREKRRAEMRQKVAALIPDYSMQSLQDSKDLQESKDNF